MLNLDLSKSRYLSKCHSSIETTSYVVFRIFIDDEKVAINHCLSQQSV